MKRFLIFIMILTIFLTGCGSAAANQPQAPVTQPAATETARATEKVAAKPGENGGSQIANPASKNCIDKGGKLDIRTESSGGQFGVCLFPNGRECEEWALMRGQCSPEGGAVGSPVGSPAYHNAAYGFGFNYPQSWSLRESGAAAGAPLTVTLVNGNNTLRLQVKRPSENTPFTAEAPQGGEISQQDSLKVLGQAVPLQGVKLEGKLKSAAVNLNSGDLQFRFQLDNNTDAEISAGVLGEVETIISSLKLNE